MTLGNKKRMRGAMPKTARYMLTWSGEQDLYRLYEHGHLLLEADSASWFTWLTTHTSFSFRGRNGPFNLLKETRKKSGEGYWYAYQRQGKRIAKRYVGRSIELFTTRLEEIGRVFQKLQTREVITWHEQKWMLTEAVEQTLQAQDTENSAALIDHYLTGRGFDDMQDLSMLRSWLEQLPDDILSRYPLLCLHYAQVLSVSVEPEQPSASTLEQINTLLQMADTCWRAEGNLTRLGEVYAFRAYLTMRKDTQEQAVAYASQALRWLPLDSQHWRGVCLNLLGSRALSCGQLNEAMALLQEALTIWTNLHHPHGTRSCMLLLATLYCDQGVLQHAAVCYRRVVQEAREVGDREDLIPALLGLAQTSYRLNDMETAEQVAQEAWDASEQWRNQELLLRSTSILVQIWSLRGPKALVQQRLTALQTRFSSRPELFTSLQPIFQTFGLGREASQSVMANLEPLSRQEQRVLHLLVAELSYPEIAHELVVSINTVKTHVNNIYRKLNVHSRREARAVVQHLHLFSTGSHSSPISSSLKNHEGR
jgi:ATP/maltotriose-dependent transcriptional regulator MalT